MLTKLGLRTGLGLAACVFGMSNVFAYGLYYVGSDAACGFTDIQQAIDAAVDPEGNTIFIAQDLVFANQQLVITDRSVSILGGLATCDAAQYIGTTAITGTSGHSVLEIQGNSHVYLGNFAISGAVMDEDHSGGGIYFGGFGSLELANTTVSNNQAGYGGGIDMSPSGGHADLTLDGDTLIIGNTALVSGGGIRIEGDTRLYVLQPNTLIEGNHALGGYGGGVEVLGPANAAIGSPGYGTLGVIYFNDAQYGGGIAVLAQRDGSGTAYVNVFTTDPANPVQISSNSASIRGGAIYIQPFTQHVPLEEGLATVCAADFRIDDNIAPDGAAVYADFDSDVSGRNVGSSLYLNESDECGETANGAVACAAGVPCNEMAQNTAEDGSGQPTDGAVILLDSTSSLNANRFILRGNTAAYGINFVGANENGYGNGGMANCLIADNHTQHELIGLRRTESTTFAVGRCTLANNTIDNGYALYANENATFSFANNIVDMPGVLTLDYTGAPGNLNLGYILSNDISTLPVDTVIQGEPTFVDAANGDYHLLPTSLGVDFAPGVGGLDLDRNTRTVDLPNVPNVYGPLDLGAYEIQVDTVLSCANADTIYCDGFDG